MNLINDAWIPVRRADGSPRTIAPWQLTESIAENPIVAIASPRPDFDGALVQFLIGVLQTICAPNTSNEWWAWREAPPAPESLRERIAAETGAFEFGGDGPAFMQDLELGPEDFRKQRKRKSVLQSEDDEDEEGLTSISNLLIDAPGKITNSDYQTLNDVSRETSTRDLKELIDKNILKSSGQKGAGAFYMLN